MRNILDRVSLTEAAFEGYVAFIRTMPSRLQLRGIVLTEVPDEDAEARPDGSLVIFLNLPLPAGIGRVELTIPAGQWAWNDRN